MIFFAGVSIRIIIRELFPYILGLIAVIVILVFYLHMTDSISDEIANNENEKISQVAENLSGLSGNVDYSDALFNRFQENGIVFHQLRPNFLNCLNLHEYIIAQPLTGNKFENIPYDDTLAVSAFINNIPYIRRNRSGMDENLTVFYPLQLSENRPALVRIMFTDLKGTDWLNKYRYEFYTLSVAVLILIIIPGLIIGLAGIRRKIEMRGYFEEDQENEKSFKSPGNMTLLDVYPSSLMDIADSPALFKLDSNHEIIHMNSAAESLIDIPLDDAIGMQFHSLPCFDQEESSSFEYPETEEAEEFTLNLADSTGSINRTVFRIESFNDSGFAVSGKAVSEHGPETLKTVTSLPKAGKPQEEHAQEHAQAPRNISDTDIQKAIDLAEAGRMLSGVDITVANHFGKIARTLTEFKQNALRSEKELKGVIKIDSELERISSALNDVLPERASIEVEASEFLQEAECSLSDFSQIIKKMVFHSLESVSGPVRIKIGARNVSFPATDPVFSAKCDGSVSRSVSISYCDGTRIPVFLKEALLDPETDSSGIQRDFGSHISSLAAILARLDLHPVFTESTTGTTLNILFSISESSLFDVSPVESREPSRIGNISIAICDASREVRNSVSDVLVSIGLDVIKTDDLDNLSEEYFKSSPDCLVLDASVLEESLEETISTLRIQWPDLKIIFTSGSSDMEKKTQIDGIMGAGILRKPYSPGELLDMIELLKVPDSGLMDIPNVPGRFE
ncbi:MAG: response regulator [Candidatus Aegiribacteria sp.]|nr:response regulator [Candidatus Aegiribacteria sp.]